MGSGGVIMKALSIIMPWSWLILHGGKDIENRTWKTDYRGRILIHASKNVSAYYYSGISCRLQTADLPSYEEIKKYCGCIFGSVELADCVQGYNSPWAELGLWHWVLKDPKPCQPIPVKGSLGLWEYMGEIKPLKQEQEG
jgi:hypothetical protein